MATNFYSDHYTLSSGVVTTPDAGRIRVPSDKNSAIVRYQRGEATYGSSIVSGDIVRLFRAHSSWRIQDFLISNTADSGSACTMHAGFYRSDGDDFLVNSNSAIFNLGSALPMTTLHYRSDVFDDYALSTAAFPLARGWPLWKLIDSAGAGVDYGSDPRVWFDAALTCVTATAPGGATVSVEMRYTSTN